ncbi:DUF2637 domain-containing protein [Micromonospora echinospora]|uniref:DUF2637 domain-containing protein n=1 Tax=Micromonospora echinospora TaxID=1877 RepID=UPI0033CD5C6D
MKTHADRVEGVVLVLIVLVVGGLAGAASFTHVHDWTMANSPAGTGDWFGWANAAISELLPLAALLTIRRRRRTGEPIGYPMFLLVAAVALSLAAQLAVAKPGLSGWLLSAVPALAFLGLTKLVFSSTPTPATVPAGDKPADEGGSIAALPEVVDDQAHANTGRTATVNQWERGDQPDGGDQAVTVEPVEPVMPVRRAGLVPVSAAAFVPRNGSPFASESDR